MSPGDCNILQPPMVGSMSLHFPADHATMPPLQNWYNPTGPLYHATKKCQLAHQNHSYNGDI